MKGQLFLVAASGAILAYFMYKKNQAANPAQPDSRPSGPYSSQQPSSLYPFQAGVAPRADNANQPWYNGSKAAMVGPSSIQNVASDLKAAGSVVHSLSDVWGEFSDWFGGNDAKSNLVATADDWSVDPDALLMSWGDENMGGWDMSDADQAYDEGMAWA